MDYIYCNKTSPYHEIKYYKNKMGKEYGISFGTEIVDISFDDAVISERVKSWLDNCNYQYSSIFNPNNGHCHFLFKRGDLNIPQGADVWTSFGVKCDIHYATGAKRQFTFLKKESEELEREMVVCADEDTFPFTIMPGKRNIKQAVEATNRNDWFYKSWRPFCEESGFSYEDYRQSVFDINQYMLLFPLSSDELEKTVLRPSAYSEVNSEQPWRQIQKDGKIVIDTYELANYILDKYYGCNILGPAIWLERWITEPGIIRDFIKREIEPQCSRRQIEEVYKWMEDIVKSMPDKESLSWQWIGFKNGILNVLDNSWIDYSPEFYIEAVIPWDYNPGADASYVGDWLSELAGDDAELKKLFLEMIGYIFFRRNEKRTAFYIYSEPQCGKSTFVNFIRKLVGVENTSTTPLTGLAKNFALQDIPGKLLLVNDDIQVKAWKQDICDNIKKIISGDTLFIDRKYQDPITCCPTAKVFVTSNEPLIMAEAGNSSVRAVIERFITIPLIHRFDNPNDNIINELCTEENFSAVINLALEAVRPIVQNERSFTQPESVKRAQVRTATNNRGLKADFLLSIGRDRVLGYTPGELARAFQKWALENHNVSMSCSARSMTTEVLTIFPNVDVRDVYRLGTHQREYVLLKQEVL